MRTQRGREHGEDASAAKTRAWRGRKCSKDASNARARATQGRGRIEGASTASMRAQRECERSGEEPQPTLPTFQLGNPRSSTTSSALAQTHSYQCIVVCDNAAMAPAQRTQRSCNRYESFKPNFWQVTEYRVPSNNTYATPQTRGAPAPVPHLRCARAQPPSA